MEKPRLIDLGKIGTPELGYITIAENSSLPFEIKRVYWTYYTPHKVIRGNHAHRTLQQLIIPVSGFFDVDVQAKNKTTYEFRLENPEYALYIPPMHWRTLKFSHNAVLLCLASAEYDADDYIRDHDEFLSL